jgi:thiamine biosynthesis protein ThiI
MIRIAEYFAGREKAEALVTGEAVGQVASQTLRNIRVIDDAASMPILRPLAGADKEETMRIARAIGTFPISSEPYDDCCSFLAPRQPATWADIAAVREAESLLAVEEMVVKSAAGAAYEVFHSPLQGAAYADKDTGQEQQLPEDRRGL